MKYILTFIMAILMVPTMTMAGTVDLGARLIQSSQGQTETAYHLGLGYKKAGGSIDIEYNYGQLGPVVSTDNARMSFGYDAQLNNTWGVWGDCTFKYDTPAGIKMENLFGAGPKYIIYHTDEIKTSLSFGYLAHNQHMLDGTRLNTQRWSWRFKFKRAVDKSEVGLVSMYQPAVSGHDYIFDNSAWYSVYINDTVDLKLSLKQEYRSASDTRKLSQIVSVAYKF